MSAVIMPRPTVGGIKQYYMRSVRLSITSPSGSIIAASAFRQLVLSQTWPLSRYWLHPSRARCWNFGLVLCRAICPASKDPTPPQYMSASPLRVAFARRQNGMLASNYLRRRGHSDVSVCVLIKDLLNCYRTTVCCTWRRALCCR